VDDTSYSPTSFLVVDLETGDVLRSLDAGVSTTGYGVPASAWGDVLLTIHEVDAGTMSSLQAMDIPEVATLCQTDLNVDVQMALGMDPPLAADGRFVMVNRFGSVDVFDAETGGLLATVEAQTRQFRLDRGRLYVSQGGGGSLTAMDLTDGRVLWTSTSGSGDVELIGPQASAERVIALVVSGARYAEAVVTGLDAATGEALWEVPIEDRLGGDLFLSWSSGLPVTEENAYTVAAGEEGYTLLAPVERDRNGTMAVCDERSCEPHRARGG
jgi:outer membrane protein assembly factor BamB